jgi:hypothetical protein
MANTKNIENTADRKAKKRELRRALKNTYAGLDKEQLRKYRKSETKGLRKFLANAK